MIHLPMTIDMGSIRALTAIAALTAIELTYGAYRLARDAWMRWRWR